MAKKNFAEENLKAMFGTVEETEQEEEEKTEKAAEPKPKKKKETPVKENPEKAAEQPQGIPRGYILREEPKSQRLQLLLKASTLQDLKELSRTTGESVNSLVNRFIEKGLNEQ